MRTYRELIHRYCYQIAIRSDPIRTYRDLIHRYLLLSYRDPILSYPIRIYPKASGWVAGKSYDPEADEELMAEDRMEAVKRAERKKNSGFFSCEADRHPYLCSTYITDI